MSKVLIILCLAIVTSMVSSERKLPLPTNIVSPAVFVKNLITIELSKCSSKYENVQHHISKILDDIRESTNVWYTEHVKKLGYIWLQAAGAFVAKQGDGTYIPPSCLQIQQNLFDYGTLVGQNLAKCVLSRQRIAIHFNETLMDNVLPYYAELLKLKNRAGECELNPDLGSTFTCLLQVVYDLLMLPNPRIALHRQLYAAQTHTATLRHELENCPYLANVMGFPNRAFQAAFQINECMKNPPMYG